MTPTQLKAISRSFRTERSRLEAAQAQARRSRCLESASRRAHRRAVRQMAEAFGVGTAAKGVYPFGSIGAYWAKARGEQLHAYLEGQFK